MSNTPMNNTPWKVVGFETWKNEEGKDRVRLYVARPLALAEDHTGDGLEVNRLYYNPQYVQYQPQCGHMIIATEGRYGIDNIWVVGVDSAA